MILQRLYSTRPLTFKDPPNTYLGKEYTTRPQLDSNEILLKNPYKTQERFKKRLTDHGYDISGLSFDFERYPGRVLLTVK